MVSKERSSTASDELPSVTKRSIALLQIWRSIDLLENHQDPICALTLAGAAEEILGRIAEKKGHCTAIEGHAIWFEGFADFLKRPRPKRQKVYKVLNKIRNELKHNDRGLNGRIQADFVFEAEEMILRAIRNYWLAFGCMPRNRLIRGWWENMCL